MIFKKVFHCTLLSGLISTAGIPTASYADNPAIARIILGGGCMVIGASKIYANKEGKTKQQKRSTLFGTGLILAGLGIAGGPEIYARLNTSGTGKPFTGGSIKKPLPPLPGKPKSGLQRFIDTWLH